MSSSAVERSFRKSNLWTGSSRQGRSRQTLDPFITQKALVAAHELNFDSSIFSRTGMIQVFRLVLKMSYPAIHIHFNSLCDMRETRMLEYPKKLFSYFWISSYFWIIFIYRVMC